MSKLICCLLFSAIALFADVTGKWTGTAKGVTPDGEHALNVDLDLKQSGNDVSGTVGSGESGDRFSITDAKLDGDTLTFKVAPDEMVYDITVTIKDDTMTGEATTTRGETKFKMKLELKRGS